MLNAFCINRGNRNQSNLSEKQHGPIKLTFYMSCDVILVCDITS